MKIFPFAALVGRATHFLEVRWIVAGIERIGWEILVELRWKFALDSMQTRTRNMAIPASHLEITSRSLMQRLPNFEIFRGSLI